MFGMHLNAKVILCSASFWFSSVCIGLAGLEPVGSIRASLLSAGSPVIAIEWDPLPSAHHYEVWFGTNSELGLASLLRSTTNSLKAQYLQAAAGVSYQFWVRGVDQDGPGPFGSPATLTQTSQIWRRELGGTPYSPVIAEDGRIIVASYVSVGSLPSNQRTKVFSLTPEGSLEWQYSPKELGNDPLAAEGVVDESGVFYFGTRLKVRAIAADGTESWATTTRGGVGGELSLQKGGSLYGLTTGPSIFAMRTNGELEWGPLLGGAVNASYVTLGSNGGLYFPSRYPDRNSINALASDGTSLWNINFQNTDSSGLSEDSQGNYLVWFDPEFLFRFDPAGKLLQGLSLAPYSLPTGIDLSIPMRRCQPIIGRDDLVYLYLSKNLVVHLACVSLDHGILWATPVPSGSFRTPMLHEDGHVSLATTNTLLTFSSDGKVESSIQLSENFANIPVLTADGFFLAATETGAVLKLKAISGLATHAPWPMYRQNPQKTGSRAPRLGKPPGSPRNVHATRLLEGVQLSWFQPESVRTTLRRSTTPVLAEGQDIAVLEKSSQGFKDAGLIPGGAYYYWIKQENQYGESPLYGPLRVEIPEQRFLWSLPLQTMFSPAIAPDGSVLIVSSSNQLVKVSSRGEILWSTSLGDLSVTETNAFAPVVDSQGNAYLINRHQIRCIRPDGSQAWAKPQESGSGVGRPATGIALWRDEFVVFSGWDNRLVALSLNGETKWTATNADQAAIGWFTGPVVDRQGNVVSLQLKDRIVSFDAAGKNRWSKPMDPSSPTIGLALDEQGNCHFSVSLSWFSYSSEGELKTMSQAEVQTRGTAAPMLLGSGGEAWIRTWGPYGPIFYSSNGVTRFSANGERQWEAGYPSKGLDGFLLSDGGAVILSSTNLARVDAQGTEIWATSIASTTDLVGPVVDCDGTIYVASSSALHAIQGIQQPDRAGWAAPRADARHTGSRFDPDIIPRLTASMLSSGHIELAARGKPNIGFVILSSADLKHWTRYANSRTDSETGQSHIEVGNQERSRFYRIAIP